MTQTNKIFCDWITVRQTHKNPHSPIYGDIAEYTNQETGEYRKVYQFKTIKGKHNSSFQIRSDGYTVEYSGNPSRYDQVNNVQGFNLDSSKIKINQAIAGIGLPPFDEGETIKQITNSGIDIEYTGAKFTRIDITQNFKTGSARRRDIYLQWIQSQNYPYLRKTLIGLNTYFGKETESRTFRIYDKALEITKKEKINKIAVTLNTIGSIRYELEYRKILKTRNINQWQKATTKTLEKHFIKDIKPMKKKITKVKLSELPPNLVGTYLMYEKGIARQLLSQSTFKRHKKQLLPYGIDISNNVTSFRPKIETIELEEFDDDELLQG